MLKLSKLEDRKKSYLGKIKELQKKVILLDHEIAYILQKNEILQLSDADNLGTDQAGFPQPSPEPAGQLSGEPEPASPRPVPVQEPKKQAQRAVRSYAPSCSSCGSRGSLAPSSRELSSGKVVNLLVCTECNTERVA